ncbi:MAG TPA: DUF3592 domain-containing protein [Planctomycetaceae bacterium]
MGLLFVVIGCGFTIYSLSFAFGTQKAQGIVIEMAGGSPIVEFTVAARKFKHHSTISTSPPSYSVGENVDVLYRPADPTNCQLDTFTDRWLFPVAFVCGGIIAMCSAAYLPKILDKFATGVK